MTTSRVSWLASGFVPAAAVLGLLLGIGLRPAAAQVVPSADAGGIKISVGGTASAFNVQYGQRKLAGIAAFADVDTRRGIGIEGEARWLDFHQIADMHIETYSIGARYHRNFGKFQPYGKGLIGYGDMNFPYNYATGRYTVVTMGGGIDYLWKHRLSIRAADFEYQYWPQFTFGSMSTVGVSAGVRYRVF